MEFSDSREKFICATGTHLGSLFRRAQMLGRGLDHHLWTTCESRPTTAKNGKKMEECERDHSRGRAWALHVEGLWTCFTAHVWLVKCA